MIVKGDFSSVERVLRLRGFDYHSYKPRMLLRRVHSRMIALGTDSYEEYSLILRRDEEEWSRLLDAFKIGYTEFFRNPSTFRLLEFEVIPEILRRKIARGKRAVRVWSAGCSTGEEAYSVGILLLEASKQLDHDFLFLVRGTDIDKRGLEVAKLGVYSPMSMRNVPLRLRELYFEPIDSKFKIKKDLLGFVKFEEHDLLRGEEKRFFDLILCRNVLIYYSRQAQERIMEKLLRALNPNSYLVLGKVEVIPPPFRDKLKAVDLDEKVYRLALHRWT